MNVLDAKIFLHMLHGGTTHLEAEKERVNALNVFPVPDGDTGTNMALTMHAAYEGAAQCSTDHLGDMAAAAAQGALLGARGNSGVILSQFFKGMATGLAGLTAADAEQTASALEQAAAAAYAAVLEPVEGTMLSVGRAGAEAARVAAQRGEGLAKVLIEALDGASQALAETPMLLEALREAGVVDAGGEGLVVAAYGSLGAIGNGFSPPVRDAVPIAPTDVAAINSAQSSKGGIVVAEHIEFLYCTEFLVHGDDLPATDIKARLLEQPGDSVLVVGDADVLKVHIHTNEPWETLAICAEFGQLADIRIDNMMLQNVDAAHGHAYDDAPQPALSTTDDAVAVDADGVGFVAVVPGPGFVDILQQLGVHSFVHGGQSMNPSTEQLLNAVQSVPAQHIVLFPNNRNISLTAEQVTLLTDKQLTIVPTDSVLQSISSMLTYEQDRSVSDNLAAMQNAFGHVQVGEVTAAVRDARLNGLAIRAGQCLGLTGGRIVCAADDWQSAVEQLVSEMLFDEAEVVTIYYGSDVTEAESKALADELEGTFPDLDIELYDGGQPVYRYLITVE